MSEANMERFPSRRESRLGCLELPLLPGEYWFGGVVRHGYQMPFGDSEYRYRLNGNLAGNQGCPLLVSTCGRYVWSEEPFSFEFKEKRLRIEEAAGPIRLGEGHGNLRGAYLAACGKFFPPSGQWPDELAFLAPQYNAWIEVKWEPTQEKIIRYAQAILDHGWPAGVLMIDDNWFRNNGNWKFPRDRFSDPRGMADWLHERGFKLVVWISPFIAPDTYTYRLLNQKKYFIYDAKGEPVIRRWWNGYSALLDLSNPAAADWFVEQLDSLVRDCGVDGFKFDGGDAFYYLPDDVTARPISPNGQCEAFARIGLRYRLSEYRACWKLGGQALIQRVRDKGHRWGTDGMGDLLPTGLAQGLMGYPFTCPDMVGGGLVGDFGPGSSVDPELFLRYAQCSALFPIIQFSTMPWRVLDERSPSRRESRLGGLDQYQQWCMEIVRLRKEVGPEILSLAKHAARTGEPIMRHMAYVFPQAGLERVMDQFMLGDDILVAPVLQQAARQRAISFPSGEWRGDDGSTVSGPCRIGVEAALSRLPWYRRKR